METSGHSVRCDRSKENLQGFYFSWLHPATFGQLASMNGPVPWLWYKQHGWSPRRVLRWSMTPSALVFATFAKPYRVLESRILPLPLDMSLVRHLVCLGTGTSDDPLRQQYEAARTRIGTRLSSLSRRAHLIHLFSSLRPGVQRCLSLVQNER